MKLKKGIALLVALMMIMTFMAACASDEPGEESEAPPVETENGEEAEGEEAEEPSGDPLSIAIVSSPSGVDDGSFNEDNYNGILAFIEENPDASVNAIREPTGDPAASVQAVADIVADYDVIVTPGFQFAGISNLAMENPDKMFILIDSEPEEIDGQTEFDNIYSMTFAEEESGFFAGIAAALETETNKVAVVNGIAFPSNVNYQFGFESGVHYANAHLGTQAEIVELPSYAGTDVTGEDIGGNYVGDFADEATGKVVGNALIDEGVDIIFVAAGGSGNGVFTAAKEASDEIYVIGCDVDQYDDGEYGGGNVIKTSVLKNMAINVERSLNEINEGSFQGRHELLRADTDSTGFVSEEGRHQLSDDTINSLDEAYEELQAGNVEPAANFNGHSPEDFPGL